MDRPTVGSLFALGDRGPAPQSDLGKVCGSLEVRSRLPWLVIDKHFSFGGKRDCVSSFHRADAYAIQRQIRVFDSDRIQGKIMFTAKDAVAAKKVAADFEANLAQATKNIAIAATTEKEFGPLVEVLKSIKATTNQQTITMEGHGGVEAVVAMFKVWFLRVQAVPVGAPAGRGN